MKNGLLFISLPASLAIIPPTQAGADPQQEFTAPPGGQLPANNRRKTIKLSTRSCRRRIVAFQSCRPL
jgi:hypothetical protein